jgi:hypothetical protein
MDCRPLELIASNFVRQQMTVAGERRSEMKFLEENEI